MNIGPHRSVAAAWMFVAFTAVAGTEAPGAEAVASPPASLATGPTAAPARATDPATASPVVPATVPATAPGTTVATAPTAAPPPLPEAVVSLHPVGSGDPAPAAPAISVPGPEGFGSGAPSTDSKRGQFPAVAWYRPTSDGETDASLPWNTALGPFDPWTRAKVALLFEVQTYQIGFEQKPLAGSQDGTTYTGGTFRSTTRGGRLEWGNWGVSFAAGRGTLGWDATPSLAYEAGVSLDMDLLTGRISRSFGAWAPFDFGRSDVRIGLALPEVYLRGSYATAKKGAAVSAARGPAMLPSDARWLGFQLGLSLLGTRLTAGDSIYLEARLGEVHVQAVAWEAAAYGASKRVQFAQWGWGWEFKPTFRAGLAF